MVPGTAASFQTRLDQVASRTDNSVHIGAPLDTVWSLTNDVRMWPLIFARYDTVEVLHEEGPTIRFRLKMEPDAHGFVWSWVSERTIDEATHSVRAHHLDAGPFRFMRVHWTYERDGRGTTLRWRKEFQARPDGPGDGDITTNVGLQMEALKNRVEVAAGWMGRR